MLKRSFLIFSILLIAYLSSLSQGPPRGTIKGKVIDRETGLSIVGANIMVVGTVLGTTTDKEGNFLLSGIPTGNRQIIISLVGYKKQIKSFSLTSTEVINLLIELDQIAIETEPFIVTANRREQSLEEVPLSVSVVTDQMIKNRHTVTLDDALKYVPGVNITRSQINIRGSTGYSYGAGSRVLLLIDGIPQLTGDTEDIIWESISPDQIKRVEVVKGAGSALYGSSALGGVINIIPLSFSTKPRTRIKFYGGIYTAPKYNSWKWSDDARTSGGFSFLHSNRINHLGFNIGGSRTLNDGYKKNDFLKRWNGWTRLAYEFSPYQVVNFNFGILEQYRGNFLYWMDVNHALESKPEQTDDNVKSLRWNVGAGYKQFITNDLFISFKTNYFRSKWEDNIPTASDMNGSGATSEFTVADLQVNYQATLSHQLTTGLIGTYNNVTSRNMFGSRKGYGGAVYAQDEINISRKSYLSMGIRYDFQKLENLSAVNQVNPKFGLTYTLTQNTTVRMSAGRGFRSPSVAEVFTSTEGGGLVIRPNSKLRPERSWSLEGGIRQTFSEFIYTDFSVFRNELWDLIEPAFGDDGYVHFFNVTRAYTVGFDAIINLSLFNRVLTSTVGYTYLYPKDVNKNEILKYRPRHLLFFSSKISVEFFQISFDFRHLSKIENIDRELLDLGIIPDGDIRVPVYVADLHLSADWTLFRLPLVTSFHIENLFQYYYTDFLANLAPLRHIVLSAEIKI